MLYELFNSLGAFPGARLMTYISFRAIMAGLIGLACSLWLGKSFIALMRRKHISETQRDEKLDPFNVGKKGVPTMGGLVIIAGILSGVLLFGKLSNIYMLMMLITTVILGALGFADDYIKTFRHNKDGLNGWVKIAGQVTLGLIIGLTLRYSPAAVMNETVTTRVENNITYVEKTPAVKSTRTTIPFVKAHNLNYADLFKWLGEENMYRAGWIFFVLLTVLVVAAVSNGANLNDGMDGMCAGNSALIGVALIVLAYVSGNYVFADYFDVMYIPGSEELVVFLAAFVGALVGFLWWNGFPAQIFMGDTGSLTIGGIIGVSAVIMHKELLLPVICGVFLMESVSVIVQTQVYKFYKKRGKHVRIWKRTPLHDHYRTSVEQVLKIDPTCQIRLRGSKELHHETKIVLRFCIVTLLLAAFAILTLKIR
ncbi:MAG: phospho-N-acetylmuramoyl-pentapeptide-transferase [Paludibacteraceae bacterium]|nr:phospho-N-acetylmuramoyl-pentapeptide-transferase [Paludibacteraceae bacterium]MBR1515908.1 phospho-N-acetylmuramoyl-pentapeptide-transferase [Paludibacteraceae bacterium]